MPPRKSASLLGSRRTSRQEKPLDEEELSGGSLDPRERQEEDDPAAGEEDWEAPPGKMTGEHSLPEVSAAEEAPSDEEEVPEVQEEPEPAVEDEPLPQLEDDESPAGDLEGRDIYGEADFPADEDSAPGSSEDVGGVRPRSRTVTRIARIEVPEEQEEVPAEVAAAAARYRFEITAGPDKGKQARFRGVRLVVGRTQGCNLKLSDGSVSRRHVELVLGEKGVLLRDLGSGNGTKVNGARVAEHPLVHGEEISIGKTVLKFVDEEEEKKAARDARLAGPPKTQQETRIASSDLLKAAPPDASTAEVAAVAEASGSTEAPRSGEAAPPAEEGTDVRPPAASGSSALTRRLAIAAAAVVVLLVGFGLYLVSKPSEGPGPKRQKAVGLLEQARLAYEGGNYLQASSLVAQAEFVLPGIDANGLGTAVKRDLAAEEAMKLAQDALDAKQYDAALAALAPVKEVGQLLAPKFEELASRIGIERSEALRRTWESAMELGDLEGARVAYGQLPPEVQGALKSRMVAFEQNMAQMTQIESEEAAAEAVRERRRARERREQAVLAALGGVARKFHGREFERAVLECDRAADENRGDPEVGARAAELRKLIPQFARSYEDGQRKSALKSYELAQKALSRARDTYLAMRLPGSLGKSLEDELITANLAVANAALKRGGDEDLRRANQLFRETLAMRPGVVDAQNGVDRIVARAEKLIVEAYVGRDKDRETAALKLKLVLELMPPKSTTWKKAKEHLAAIEL